MEGAGRDLPGDDALTAGAGSRGGGGLAEMGVRPSTGKRRRTSETDCAREEAENEGGVRRIRGEEKRVGRMEVELADLRRRLEETTEELKELKARQREKEERREGRGWLGQWNWLWGRSSGIRMGGIQ
jgi:hypothetical protein